MIDAESVERIINEKRKMHDNDPRISEIWEQLIEIFTKNEAETIDHLNNCSENQLYHISGVFEDI